MTAGNGFTGVLAQLSDELAQTVEAAGRYVVRVDARRRISGTGVVWDPSGLIITADHVLERDEDISVGLPGGREVPATIAGRDPSTDLALLRVQSEGLTAAERAETPRVGSIVLALGAPWRGEIVATAGIVNAVDGAGRRGGRLSGLIRFDAALYPGFSGGPLVDASGRLLGINTSYLAQGASLAVPAATVERVAQALRQSGRVRRAFLGITSQPVALSPRLRSALGISQESGVVILGVEPDGAADRGGLLLGDVILGLDDAPVRHAEDLQRALAAQEVGQPLTVHLLRGGGLSDITVTPGERP